MRALFVVTVLTATFSIAALAAEKRDPVAIAYSRCTDVAMKPDADPAAGITACREAAEAGVPGAQYAMGALLLNRANGQAAPEAAQWLERAVANGHPGASYLLARIVGNADPSAEGNSSGLRHVASTNRRSTSFRSMGLSLIKRRVRVVRSPISAASGAAASTGRRSRRENRTLPS